MCALAPLLAASASCTLVYDADVFQYIDAAPPDVYVEPPPPPPPPDAELIPLILDRLDPAEVLEGAGCVPAAEGCRADSRPVPVVIHGSGIAEDASIVLNGAGFADYQVPLIAISPGGDMAAFAVSVPVLPELADGDSEVITVIVRQDDAEQSRPLSVRGLDELLASQAAPEGTLDVGQLRARYSRIAIDQAVQLTGNQVARLVATAEIVVAAELRADGQNASGGTPGAGGPGGGAGGAAEQAGDFEGGGGAGNNASGGGGGGHAEEGSRGGGNQAGAGGTTTGRAILTPLTMGEALTARGHGGGGGGNNALENGGGGGGGGGGTLELTSQGSLRLTAKAILSAKGGNGALGACNGLAPVGSGGGGSGGAILVRAALAFADEGSDARVDVGPGSGPEQNGCRKGGDGAPGRVRVDLPATGELPAAFTGVTHLYRGPMWSPDTPSITTRADVNDNNEIILTLLGTPQETVFVDIEGETRRELGFPMDGVIEVAVPAAEGLRELCARVTDDAHASQPDAANCIDLAYIPSP